MNGNTEQLKTTLRDLETGDETIVHANAHHMATVIENTRDAIARIKAAGTEILAIKRLD